MKNAEMMMTHRHSYLFLVLFAGILGTVLPVHAQQEPELHVSLEMDLSTALTSNPPRITFTARTDRNDLTFEWQEKSDYTGYLQSNLSDTAYYTLEGDNRDTGVTITVTVTDPDGHQASAVSRFQTARISEKLETMRKNQGRNQDVEAWQAKHEALEQMLFSHIRAYEESRSEGSGAVDKIVRRVQDIVDELNAIEAHCKRFPGLPGEVQEIRTHYLAQKDKWTAELAHWKRGADAVQAESELLDLVEEWRKQLEILEQALDERVQAGNTGSVAEIRAVLEAVDNLEHHCESSPVKDKETRKLLKNYKKLKKKWQARLDTQMAVLETPPAESELLHLTEVASPVKIPQAENIPSASGKPEAVQPPTSPAEIPQTAKPETLQTAEVESPPVASKEIPKPETLPVPEPVSPAPAETTSSPVKRYPARKKAAQKSEIPQKKKSRSPNYRLLEDSVGVSLK